MDIGSIPIEYQKIKIMETMTEKTVKEIGIERLASLNRVRYLNRGGCLYACLAVFTSLKRDKLNNEDIVIVQLENFNTESITQNKKFIEGMNKKAYSSSHFGLSFDGGETFYDSEGLIAESRYPLRLIIPNNMIEKFAKNSLKYGGWNFMFDREEGVAQINEILKTKIKVYPYLGW